MTYTKLNSSTDYTYLLKNSSCTSGSGISSMSSSGSGRRGNSGGGSGSTNIRR